MLEVKFAFSGTTAKLGVVVFKCHSPVHPYQYRYLMIFIDDFAQDFPEEYAKSSPCAQVGSLYQPHTDLSRPRDRCLGSDAGGVFFGWRG